MTSIAAQSQGYAQFLGPLLSVQLVEQPTEFYRYRYESEVTGGKVGGLLLGRSSSGSNKAFIKLRVEGIDSLVHSRLQLTVCTVSPDEKHHPYYLHGDNCRDGFYLVEKTIDQRSQSYWEVKFDRLAVICVQKTREAIAEGTQRRAASAPNVLSFFKQPTEPYDNRNIGKIRLAFVLSILEHSGAQRTLFLTSDEISDKKESKSLELDELNPNEVSSLGGTEIAIYVKTSAKIKGVGKADAVVQFALEGGPVFQCPVREIRKHLITVLAPNVKQCTSNERARATVTIHIGEAVSTELSVVFYSGLPQSVIDGPRKQEKRQRELSGASLATRHIYLN